MKLKDVPIQRKLTTIMLLISGIVLLLTGTAFTVYELVTFHKTRIDEMETMADIIAANSTASLVFNDNKTAQEILSTLRADRTIVRAGLYDANGALFATFPDAEPTNSFPQASSHDGHYFEHGQAILFYPIKKDGNRLGTLYLNSDLRSIYERVELYAGIVALIMAGSLFLAYFLSKWLQKSISKPIVDLAETAKFISKEKNYLVRADKFGNDEIGELTEAFNDMLAQIHGRDLALRASQERLKLALSASQTGTWDWDLKTNKMAWDEFTHLLFGLKPGTFAETYESFINLIHPSDRVTISQAAEESLQSGKEFNVEFQVVWPDGSTHHIASRGKAIYDENKKPIRMTGVCLDITDRKRAEEEIRTLNAELEGRVLLRTAELTASTREMEAFTYSVSHDLRAPLRHIIAFGEILQEEFSTKMESTAQDYLGRIMNGARSMSHLVDDLLNLARIGRQGLNRQSVNLNMLVAEVVSELKPEIGQRNIEWKIEHLSEAACDPGLIKQVLANLLSNAIKYTGPREKAVIEVGRMKVDGQKVIFIRDNGVGFNMKFADKLFGVFQRLHRADEFEGTGVGLATVERIILKHGGRVWAESELGKGATFYFTLESDNKNDAPKAETSFFLQP